MKFSITYFFRKCNQIRCFLRIWSHLLKKSILENFIFLCSERFYQHCRVVFRTLLNTNDEVFLTYFVSLFRLIIAKIFSLCKKYREALLKNTFFTRYFKHNSVIFITVLAWLVTYVLKSQGPTVSKFGSRS